MNSLYERLFKNQREYKVRLNVEKYKTKIIKENEKAYKSNYLYKILIIFLIYMILSQYIDSRTIKVAFYYYKIKYGGIERVLALLLNILSEEKSFTLYLITEFGKLDGEYPIPNNIKRIFLSEEKISLYNAIRREHIDIFLYNSYEADIIKKLHRLKNTKIITCNHSSYFLWIYFGKYTFKDSIYNIYKDCKYVISLIPFENDYLFKIWGINSFFMDNPLTFDYDAVVPSNLTLNNIVMIGRGNDLFKRYDIGIKAMKSIVKEIPDSKMYLIVTQSEDLEKLIKTLNLEESVKFTGFQKNIEIYLQNASLHIFPSISEAYPMVLSETKIYGIPTILCGLDFLALAKGGTVIIYDDNPDTVAKEAIKILKNETYRKILGAEARKSIEKRKNNLIGKRWVKLLHAIFEGDDKTYRELGKSDISKEEGEQILKNQLKLIQMRIPKFKNITLEQLKYYSLL